MQVKYAEVLPKEKQITEDQLNQIGLRTESVKFETRTGKWSMIDTLTCSVGDSLTVSLAIFGLFEHDTLGDETDYVLAFYDWFSGDNNWKEIAGTFDDIETSLRDNEILDY